MGQVPVAACMSLIFLLYGVTLFAAGFFLSRTELPFFSACSDICGDDAGTRCSAGSACWALGIRRGVGGSSDVGDRVPRFQRLVFIVIDAWRYDFADPDAGVAAMPALARRLSQARQGSDGSGGVGIGLFPFIADAPTVTMQRLKGLLTGSLPTFLDVAPDLSTAVLQEDNLLAAAARVHAARDRLFFGDDTWMSLAPAGAFTAATPYDSLNVRDLHTVDSGVTRDLLPLLRGEAARSGNWSVVVAHFLGVDHVGHTFNTPHHGAMAAKLAELDGVLDGVLSAVGDDTLVAVLGDHGMTEGGAHGGDSVLETHAALLLYAQGGSLLVPPPPPSPHGRRRPAVAQVDLVPTLALLTGLPIPYSSLGRVIPDTLFVPPAVHEEAHPACARLHAAAAAAINARQVGRYLHSYAARMDGGVPDAVAAAARGIASGLADWLTLMRQAAANLSLPATACTPAEAPIGGGGSAPHLRHRTLAPDLAVARCLELHVADAVCSSSNSSGSNSSSSNSVPSLALRSEAARHTLHTAVGNAAQACREQWTQFDDGAMGWGVALVAAAAAAAVAGALRAAAAAGDAAAQAAPTPSDRAATLLVRRTVARWCAAGCAAHAVAQPGPTLAAVATAGRVTAALLGIASSGSGGLGGPGSSSAPPPPTATLLEYGPLPAAWAPAVAALRLPVVLPPGAGCAVACAAGWLLHAVRVAGAQAGAPRGLFDGRQSHRLPPFSFPAIAGLVLLVRRVDTAFSSSFLVEEGRVAAFFAASAVGILAAAATRAWLPRAAARVASATGVMRSIAITTAVALAALRLVAPSAGGTWRMHAPDALSTPAVALFIAAPLLVPAPGQRWWIGASGAACHAALNAAVAAYWYGTQQADAGSSSAAIRLALPRVTAVASVTAAVAAVALAPSLPPSPPHPPSVARVLVHPAVAALRFALPLLHLLAGPASMATLPLLAVATVGVAVLEGIRAAGERAEADGGAAHSGWGVATSVLRSDAWLVALAASFVGDAAFYATGHASHFSDVQVGAAYLGWDTFSPLRAGLAVAGNTWGPSAAVTATLVGVHPAAAAAALVPPVLQAAAATVMCAVSRRHLMTWALFAPRFAFAAGGGIVAAVVCVAVLWGQRGERPHGQPAKHARSE